MTIELRRPEAVTSASPYAGLARRAIALAADAALVNAAILVVGLAAGLGLSLFYLPSAVAAALVGIGAALALVWTIGYFVVFWCATGQTPGNWLMEIRVQDGRTGELLRPRRAMVRVLLLPLSAIRFGAGFLLVLVDQRRSGLHDCLARTVVVDASAGSRRTP